MTIKFIVYRKRYIHNPKTESKEYSSVGRMPVEYSRGPGAPFPVAHKPRKWCFPVILALGRWRQEDQEFKGHSQQHIEFRVPALQDLPSQNQNNNKNKKQQLRPPIPEPTRLNQIELHLQRSTDLQTEAQNLRLQKKRKLHR